MRRRGWYAAPVATGGCLAVQFETMAGPGPRAARCGRWPVVGDVREVTRMLGGRPGPVQRSSVASITIPGKVIGAWRRSAADGVDTDQPPFGPVAGMPVDRSGLGRRKAAEARVAHMGSIFVTSPCTAAPQPAADGLA